MCVCVCVCVCGGHASVMHVPPSMRHPTMLIGFVLSPAYRRVQCILTWRASPTHLSPALKQNPLPPPPPHSRTLPPLADLGCSRRQLPAPEGPRTCKPEVCRAGPSPGMCPCVKPALPAPTVPCTPCTPSSCRKPVQGCASQCNVVHAITRQCNSCALWCCQLESVHALPLGCVCDSWCVCVTVGACVASGVCA
jgi:hypothetical protein